jgi:hypothetical protein
MALSTTLNKTNSLKIYWIFLYSYNDNVTKELPVDKILLFPVTYYTKTKNGSLPTLMLQKALNLDEDEDLDMIISKFKLNYVRTVSEMVISHNTNLIAIQIDRSKKLKGYVKNNNIYFYTIDNPPENYIYDGPLKNKLLLNTIKVSVGSKFIVSTNVTLEQVFRFVFKDHFEAIIQKCETSSPTRSKETFINKDRDIEESEESDGYDTDATTDSELSLYSYNKKYNIKDI